MVVQLYNHLYNMDLLLIEPETWTFQLKVALANAQELKVQASVIKK